MPFRACIAPVLALALLFALPARGTADGAGMTFADYGNAAVATLEQTWYDEGRWRMCLMPGCRRQNSDWGADALTNGLYLRWLTTHDPALQPYFAALGASFVRYGTPCAVAACARWSDVPAWDALAALHDYAAGGNDPVVLAVATAAFDAAARGPAYARGACPSILYQQAFGGTNGLKTLETDSNLIRAAVLLHRYGGRRAYLRDAAARYRNVRRFFLDPAVPLYTAYVFDDGTTCRRLDRRFFASVNGNMIEAGVELYRATGDVAYRREAIATAAAVAADLADARGIFVDEQAENDVVEPLVEAMYDLATREGQAFARRWLLRNAEAAVSSRTPDGSFGRFFDGPPPAGPSTAWQTNGGFALEVAAAALAPDGRPQADAWEGAAFVARDAAGFPLRIAFTGSSIALVGTVGERCCESGHARVVVDGVETFDRTGIWQNKSSSGRRLPHAVLFAWRWPHAGKHAIVVLPGVENAKEGAAYIHVEGYVYK